MPTRICTKCKKEKDISEFHRHTGYPDNLDYHCKECANTGRVTRRKLQPKKYGFCIDYPDAGILAAISRVIGRCNKYVSNNDVIAEYFNTSLMGGYTTCNIPQGARKYVSCRVSVIMNGKYEVLNDNAKGGRRTWRVKA